MARDYRSEHRGNMHEEGSMGSQGKCPNCDPWHEEYIPSTAPKAEIKDAWTDAWIASQKDKNA